MPFEKLASVVINVMITSNFLEMKNTHFKTNVLKRDTVLHVVKIIVNILTMTQGMRFLEAPLHQHKKT